MGSDNKQPGEKVFIVREYLKRRNLAVKDESSHMFVFCCGDGIPSIILNRHRIAAEKPGVKEVQYLTG